MRPNQRASILSCLPALAMALLSAATATASDYPAKPVRLITQGAAGSGPDVIVRIVAAHLARRWGQQVLVVNQAGGGGVLAGRAAASADPDGYTLYVPTITTFVIMPEIQPALPFDLNRDFTPVGFFAETPMMIGAAPSLGIKSLSDLLRVAKARPKELFYAANNRGSLPHLTAELLRARTGADLTFVPYQGATAGLQDLRLPERERCAQKPVRRGTVSTHVGLSSCDASACWSRLLRQSDLPDEGAPALLLATDERGRLVG